MSTLTPTQSVGERFENLIISPLRVSQMLGKRSPGEVTYEESEQSDARRRLLHVEKIAIKNKHAQTQSQACFFNNVASELHNLIVAEIQTSMQSSRDVFTRVLSLSDEATALIDILSTRAASISKLEPHTAALPWMYDELMQTVNAPAFRRRDSRGRVIIVESLKTALSFLGVENLRLLVPLLVLQRAIPQVTDPYPQIKQTLRQYSLGTAVTARELAVFSGVKPYDAYVMGMLSHLGRCALVRLYFRLFDQIQRNQLLEAQQKKQRDKHHALLQIKPSAKHLMALQQEYAPRVTADLFEHMVFKRLAVTQPMRQFCEAQQFVRGSAADVLKSAQCYTHVRMLHRHRFIEKDEVRQQLKTAHYPSGAIDTLNSINIFELPLTSEQGQKQRA